MAVLFLRTNISPALPCFQPELPVKADLVKTRPKPFRCFESQSIEDT